MATGPCDDLRIIDLSRGPAGGIATMVLGPFQCLGLGIQGNTRTFHA